MPTFSSVALQVVTHVVKPHENVMRRRILYMLYSSVLYALYRLFRGLILPKKNRLSLKPGGVMSKLLARDACPRLHR